MTARTVIVATAIAAMPLVAGCSSADTKNDYVDTVNEIQTNALEAFNQAAASTPKNQQAMVEQLEAGEAALADAVTRLEEVEVPEEAQAGHPDLVAGIDDLRALFESTAEDVRAAEGTQAFAAVTALASEGAVIGTEIDEAITRINEDLGAD
jgi:outer membrane murein-binding lipoprotein Lpp